MYNSKRIKLNKGKSQQNMILFLQLDLRFQEARDDLLKIR